MAPGLATIYGGSMATRRAVLPGLIALLLAAPDRTVADGSMQPGMWEITVTVEMPGTAMALPPTVQTQCMSQKDVDAEPVPSLDQGACRATDIRRAGSKVTWKLTCSGPTPGRGEGEITYQGPTAYDGWMTLETNGVVVRTRLQARRVGGC